jgi:hypothetical protein
MFIPSRIRGALAAGALLLILDPTRAASQEPEDDEAKAERIASTYRLTEPMLKKYAAAMRELVAVARKNPAIVATDESDEKKAHPQVRAIFARVGLTEDEAEKFAIAVAYAQMGSLGASMSGEAARELQQAPPVLRANVAFLKTHDAALKALGTDMKALQAIQEGKTEAAVEAESGPGFRVTGAIRAGVTSEIELEVIGGRHAGRYTAKVSEGGCSYGMTKPGAWGNQYSIDTKDAPRFSSLQLIVSDAKAAAAGTNDFMMMVSFGSLLGGTHYKVEPGGGRRTEGSGTVAVEDSGAGATVPFDAKTKDGVGLKGRIKCYSVMRNG